MQIFRDLGLRIELQQCCESVTEKSQNSPAVQGLFIPFVHKTSFYSDQKAQYYLAFACVTKHILYYQSLTELVRLS